MNNFEKYLNGSDLRSLGESDKIISFIKDQNDFDELFKYLFNIDRNIRMKAIDVVEKIICKNNHFLQKHKTEIIKLSNDVENIEFKWHLAQLFGKLIYEENELQNVWEKLREWVLNKKESKIVRVNSLQSLYELAKINGSYEKEINGIIKELEKENIPSMKARIKKIIKIEKRTAAIRGGG
jgi:hypothetical protein